MEISDALLVHPVNKLIADNTLRAAFAYPLIWLILTILGGAFNTLPAETYVLVTAVLLLLSVVRFWQARRIDTDSAEVWSFCYSGLNLGNAALWSAISVWMVLQSSSDSVAFAWLLAITGLIAAGVTFMSAKLGVALAFQAILLLPELLCFALVEDRASAMTASLITIYWLHMALLSIQQSRYHRANILDRIKLEAYAARLKDVSEHDQLTGLANRRYFDSVFEQEWDRLARSKGELAVLMIDLDHFKQVNDNYGHLIGDSCLREVAERLQAVIHRPADLLARYGGEEFIVLLPDTSLEGARQIAELMCETIAARPLDLAGDSIPITISVGLATASPVPGDSRDNLLRRVDDALYCAKARGRNRVEVATGTLKAALEVTND